MSDAFERFDTLTVSKTVSDRDFAQAVDPSGIAGFVRRTMTEELGTALVERIMDKGGPVVVSSITLRQDPAFWTEHALVYTMKAHIISLRGMEK